MKKIIVIGGGIAGLSAGVYAQKCGFDVTVLESHSVAGGICTSWRRGGYLFEGGMHWLAGSGEREALHKCWRHVGALDDGVAIRYSEPFIEFEHGGEPIRLYRDVDETERRLLEIAPRDAKEIKTFCGCIRKVARAEMPIADLRGVRMAKGKRARASPRSILSLLPAARVMAAYSGLPRKLYASRFSHAGIREMLLAMPGSEQGIAMLFMTMGALARGDGGFPEGGSLPFVKRIVDAFEAAGGKLELNARAERVVVERGRATGAAVAGSFVPADAVIVATDTMAIDSLFDDPPKAPWLDRMRAATGPTSATFVSLGIAADLGGRPERPLVRLPRPISLAGRAHESLLLANYAGDRAYSPEGKTALTAQLPGDSRAFWKKAREEGRYAGEKRRVADELAAALAGIMPETRGRVEVADVATPLTYERYCGSWKGSWMTEIRRDTRFAAYPPAVPGLAGAYFASHRMMPPGGLPPALLSGRAAVQRLCIDAGAAFVGED